MFIHFSINIRSGEGHVHEKHHYNKKGTHPKSRIDTLITFVDMIDQPHKIKTYLVSISLPELCSQQEVALESTNIDFSSAEYRVTSVNLYLSHFRLFRPVKSDVPAEKLTLYQK